MRMMQGAKREPRRDAGRPLTSCEGQVGRRRPSTLALLLLSLACTVTGRERDRLILDPPIMCRIPSLILRLFPSLARSVSCSCPPALALASLSLNSITQVSLLPSLLSHAWPGLSLRVCPSRPSCCSLTGFTALLSVALLLCPCSAMLPWLHSHSLHSLSLCAANLTQRSSSPSLPAPSSSSSSSRHERTAEAPEEGKRERERD